jgi:DNA mismatch repair protein MutL
MSYMFNKVGYAANQLNLGNLNEWKVGNVTQMQEMFNRVGYNAKTWNIGDLSSWDTSKVTNMSNMFNRAGFSFEEFGENTIKLMSVPSMCEDMNTKQLFLDILDEIDTVAVTARQEKEDKFIATIACKAAVKAKMKLDDQEVATLMAQLLELPNPFTCPHGRPTAIKMTKTDLEKKFSRR